MTPTRTGIIALAATLAAAPLAMPAAALADPGYADATTDDGLAAEPLARGEQVEAIAILERQLADDPNDPALLINLGIAQAQRGNDAAARNRFEAAMTSPEAIDLETANGSLIGSRQLARLALAMLDRGEFASTRNDRVSLRR